MRNRRPLLALAAVLVLFALVRLPLFLNGGVFLGWNSDAAIIGLMGKKILEGRGFDIYFWGQNYMGPLTSLVAAAVGAVRKVAGVTPAVGPVALRLATSLMIATGIIIYWFLLRRVSLAVATLTAAFLAVGPYVLYRASLVAWGIDMVFLLGAIIVASGTRLTPASPMAHRFAFGVLCGICWWMNQQVIFFIAAVTFVVLRHTLWYGVARNNLRLRDRLLFRTGKLRDSERALLVFAEVLLIGELLYVVLRGVFHWQTPVPGFRWHFGEPFVALILLHLIVAVATRDPIVTSIRFAAVVRYLAPAAAGFILGYAPVILGGILGWYPRSYSFGAGFSDPPTVFASIADLFRGALPSVFGSLGAFLVAAVAITAFWLRRRSSLPLAVDAMLIAAALNLVYCLLLVPPPITRRYLISAIPGLFAIAAIAIVDLARERKSAAIAAALVIFVSLGASSYEMMADLRAEPDPRVVIASVRSHGCRVVYAEFWTAYKYRFLSDEEFLFIVHQSQDRTPEDSKAFARAPGRRCLLEPSGRLKLMNELAAVPDVIGEDVFAQAVR